jgi:L-fuconolactonase
MPDFPIVDTHVHLWHPKALRYPWLEGVPSLNKPFLLKDYQAACGGVNVEAMAFVQCDAHPDDGLKEADWVASLAKEDGRLKGIVAWAPLEKGEGARPTLEQLAKNPLVKGVRRLIQSEALDFCIQPNFIKGVQMLEAFDYSFDICIFHPQLANVIQLVKRCPNIPFILDHIGKPDIKNQVFEPWKQEIKKLSEWPNVCCKISGLVTEADHAKWTPGDLQPYIDHVIAYFGFDRVIYGSDWPVSTLATEYPKWVETLEQAVSGCTQRELRKLFRENATRFYRLARS